MSYSKKEIKNSFSFKNLSWTLKFQNFFGFVQVFQYTVHQRNESYILISRECIEDANYSFNYLEKFLRDFNRSNWDDKELLEQYCEIYKEINPKFFPQIFLPHKRIYVNYELETYHQEILGLVNNPDNLMTDSTELCWRLTKMVDFLREIDKLELMMDAVRLDKYKSR